MGDNFTSLPEICSPIIHFSREQETLNVVAAWLLTLEGVLPWVHIINIVTATLRGYITMSGGGV